MRALLLLCAFVSLIRWAYAADFPGIVPEDQVGSTAAVESANPVSCSLVLEPYNITKFQRPSVANQEGAVQHNAQPDSYTAQLDFVTRNLGTKGLAAPWTLSVTSPNFQSVKGVRNAVVASMVASFKYGGCHLWELREAAFTRPNCETALKLQFCEQTSLALSCIPGRQPFACTKPARQDPNLLSFARRFFQVNNADLVNQTGGTIYFRQGTTTLQEENGNNVTIGAGPLSCDHQVQPAAALDTVKWTRPV